MLGLGRMNIVLQCDIPEGEVEDMGSHGRPPRNVWVYPGKDSLDIAKYLTAVFVVEPAEDPNAAPEADTTTKDPKALSPTLKTLYKYMKTANAPSTVSIVQCRQTSASKKVKPSGAPMTVKKDAPNDTQAVVPAIGASTQRC